MGIRLDVARTLARLLPTPALGGRALTFGVQQVEARYDDLAQMFQEERYPYTALSPDEIEMDTDTGQGRTIHQRSLFRMLGFESVDSLDIFSNEHPTFVVDLNHPLPEGLTSYDLVLDGGTTEHCFNVPQVLANAVRLVKLGGHIVHVSPISGWINHGFYQFSPTLFFDYYATNGFVDLRGDVVFDGRRIDLHNYLADDRPVPRSDFLGHTALIVFIARKVEERTPREPVQRYYREAFGGDPPIETGLPRELERVFDVRQLARDAIVIARTYSRLMRARRM